MTAVIATDYISDMRDRLKAYFSETRSRQAQTAWEMGISQPTLSQFLNDRYIGNNEQVARKVEQFLKLGAIRREPAKAPPFSPEVGNTKKMLYRIHNAHMTQDVLLIHGPAGCGKTTTLRHYAQTVEDAVYIEADVTMNTHRAILMTILEELDSDTTGSVRVLMRRLLARLRERDRLIIIDEAQHLTEKSLEAVRALNDKAGTAIVFAGNPRILTQMYGRKKEDFDQVYSRIGWHCALENRYTAADIAAIFQGYELSRECLKYLHSVSRRKGGLRLMIKQYRLAANIAVTMEQELAVVHLDEAAKRMGFGGVSA